MMYDYNPRYVAEVSASAVAVERLARQGGLDLQPAVVSQDVVEEEEEEEEEGEVEEIHQGEENSSEAGVDPVEGSCGDIEQSSQQVIQNLEKTTLVSSSSASESVIDNQDSKTDQTEEIEQFSSADIDDMRDTLVSASQEAQQLLSDLNTR